MSGDTSSFTTVKGVERPVDPARTRLRRIEFRAMGTRCSIQFACEDPERGRAYEQAAKGWVDAFEAKYSRFRPDSLVSRINAAAGREWVSVDAEMESLLDLCDTLHGMTRGILDPTMLPLIRLWDYKAQCPEIPDEGRIAAAMRLTGWHKVQRAPGRVFLPAEGMSLDFGGFGKEYAVDMVAMIAANHGITDVLVDFGHDLRALGQPPGVDCWHVGLEDPDRPGSYSERIGVTGKGVASSGDYLRCFVIDGRRYGHIIDPRTGWPVANGCTQATVIADTCLQAGVLSTTAFVLGHKDGIEFIQGFPGAEGLLVTTGARAQTRGLFTHVLAS